MDNRDPYIYKTTDFGQTWTKISDGLPKGHPLAYAMSVAENPNRKGMLFAGTGNGFYYSLDDGAKLDAVQGGAAGCAGDLDRRPEGVRTTSSSRPTAAGSSFLRDITRLEQRDQIKSDTSAFLYAPRPGFRQARNGTAEFLYQLPTAPGGPVRVEILDSAGKVVRTFTMPPRAGLSRATWDLRYDAPRQVALCTTPPDNPHIWDEPRFKGTEDASDRSLGNSAAPAIGAARDAWEVHGPHDRGRPNPDAAIGDSEGPGDRIIGGRPAGVDRDAGPHSR